MLLFSDFCRTGGADAEPLGNELHDGVQFIQFEDLSHTLMRRTEEAVHLPSTERASVVADERQVRQQLGVIVARDRARRDEAERLSTKRGDLQIAVEGETRSNEHRQVEIAGVDQIQQLDREARDDPRPASWPQPVEAGQCTRQLALLRRCDGAKRDRYASL